ncbi:MAG: hypothetical protein ABL921_15545 [Pirellula sp.]
MAFSTLAVLLFAQLADNYPISIPTPAIPILFGDGQVMAVPLVPNEDAATFPTIDHAALQTQPSSAHMVASNFEANMMPWTEQRLTDLTNHQYVSDQNPYALAGFDGQIPVPPADDSVWTQNLPWTPNATAQVPILPSAHSNNSVPARRHRMSLFRNWLRRRTGPDLGIGYERVMFAPMVLDTAISSSNTGIRLRSDRGLSAPDRLEYVWARAGGRGPAPETRLDLIDTVYRTELGNAQATLISEISMRALNPEVNPNTVGFGDMVLGGKALMYDGKCTKVSSLFLSYLNTGPTYRGLGTGHVSLEPGLLLRHQWSDATYLHSEIKYRLPIAGTSGFAGDVLTTGWGISTIWRDTDTYALIPTMEMRTNSFLFGGRTLANGTTEKIDGVTAVEFYPGMRCAFGKSSVGTWELGFAGGATLADNDWCDSRMILDLRLVR